MPLVRVKQKFQVTIPTEIREALDLEVGDVLEAVISNKSIVLKPKVVVDRDAVDAAITEGLEDLRAGRSTGPFASVEELKASLQQ